MTDSHHQERVSIIQVKHSQSLLRFSAYFFDRYEVIVLCVPNEQFFPRVSFDTSELGTNFPYFIALYLMPTIGVHHFHQANSPSGSMGIAALLGDDNLRSLNRRNDVLEGFRLPFGHGLETAVILRHCSVSDFTTTAFAGAQPFPGIFPGVFLMSEVA